MDDDIPYKATLQYTNPCEPLLDAYTKCTAQQDASRRTNYNCEHERLEYVQCTKKQQKLEKMQNWKVSEETERQFFDASSRWGQRRIMILGRDNVSHPRGQHKEEHSS
mmetsp:Transcript_2119/g.7677  ORF Transcript_2119/g.7677 Transcript_2119/m.7677 type:complete len:108 (-) Transcript_2119:3753-4076(-)